METELTKIIKNLTHTYKPQMSSGAVGRTIRYADEVWTPNGIVDSIRFEDYVTDQYEECKRINFEPYVRGHDGVVCNLIPGTPPLGQCKIPGQTFSCKDCKGCFFHVKNIKSVDMMITAYEVKITLSDFKSKNGHNIDDINSPIANENYYCVPKELSTKIEKLVPDHVGILVYDGNGLRKKKAAAWLQVDDNTKILLLYNALKKWCDGNQTP